MAASQDTEITLGTGKVLALFFALVVLCAIFFSVGYSMGHYSDHPAASTDVSSPAASAPGVRPSANKAAGSPSASTDLTFYKAVGQKDSDAQLTAAVDKPAESADATASSTSAESAAPPAGGGYVVQVAAVSKQEDAEALVAALKKKQYAAFAVNNSPSDKLFHVQVGPFADIKEAEGLRAKLVADGYNPILKK